jgi:flagellar assembly protein FliH
MMATSSEPAPLFTPPTFEPNAFFPAERAPQAPQTSQTPDQSRVAGPKWLAQLDHSAGFKADNPWMMPSPTQTASPSPAPALEGGPVKADHGQGVSGAEDPLHTAYAKGVQEGRKAALEEQARDAAAMAKLSASLTQFSEIAATTLQDHLIETVTHLCSQMIEPHLIDGPALQERCSALAQTMKALPQHCTLALHPLDAQLLEAQGEETQLTRGWTIAADSNLARGTLILEGPQEALADGPEQWAAAIKRALQT